MNYQYNGKDIALLQFLEERIRRNPASSFFAMLAYFYLEIDKVAEALSVAQRGVIAHPNYSTGHAVLAMAMMRAGFFSDAKKELLKASDLHPGSKMIDLLTAELEKHEQADTIGKKLAEQFRKRSGASAEKVPSRPARAGADIMKKVEQTLKENPAKSSDEDFLIPGLDAIVGGDLSKLPAQFKKPPQPDEPPIISKLEPEKKSVEREDESSIARAIIDKVTREFEIEKLSDEKNNTVEQAESREVEPDEDEFDIDALARELVSAGQIKPTEDRSQSRDRDEDQGIELTPEIVTDTLAMIFEQQGQIKTAIEAYSILIKKKPERADFYSRKIADLKSRTDAPH